MTKWVRVIVTCYNHQDYIQECLESIFKQTYPYIRLAVFNDGSTDNSQAVIEQTLQYASVAYQSHYQFNQGLVKTRNLALDTYQGQEDYLLFVDSDNFLEPNYIEAMVEVAEQGADVVYADLINPEDNSLVVQAKEFDLEAFYQENFIDSCSLIKQSIIGSVRYDKHLNYKSLEDYDFFFQLILSKRAVAKKCSKTFLNYRVLDGSVNSRGDYKKYYDSYFYILGKYFSICPALAQTALLLNSQRFYELVNLQGSYANQKVTIFFESENSESKIISTSLKKGDVIEFTIPEGCRIIRVDLSELPSYYTLVRLIDSSNQTVISPISTNAINIGESFYFNQIDPQLYYDVSEKNKFKLQLQYSMANISNLLAEDFLIKPLTIQLEDDTKRLVELRKDVNKLTENYQELIEKYGQLLHDYNSVITSRRWKIPTKIINILKFKK